MKNFDNIMSMKFNMKSFAADFHAYKGDRSFRDINNEIGLSVATLSRIGKSEPDLMSYYKVCRWMKVNPNTYFDETFESRLKDILTDITASLYREIGEKGVVDIFAKINAL